MSLCIVFVCQAGELELKAMLLAASLRDCVEGDVDLVAAVPDERRWGFLAATTRLALDSLGVRQVPIENPVSDDYPIGNKLACLAVATPAARVAFLDSDIVCMSKPDMSVFRSGAVSVKPVDLATSGTGDLARWRAIYQAVGTEMPDVRVKATVSGESIPPYFNAGVVCTDAARQLAAEWIRCARILDANPGIVDKRPWLDQLALPAAIQRLGLPVDLLDERYNSPAHLKVLGERPVFCHYHWPAVLRREPEANALVADLAARTPALAEAMASHPDWAPLLQPRRVGSHLFLPATTAPPPGPELLITGIPRSGTSFLCKLVNDSPGCVVVNEPAAIFAPLASQPVPYGVGLHHAELRSAILDGRPIANKLHNGEFIEDTAVVDTVESYMPDVAAPDFLLGTKNTLAYMARLPHLEAAMPRALIVACVRHPEDTIASWKSTFPHLREADLEGQVLGHSRDPLLDDASRARLREIAATSEAPRRRALLWCHLALLLLEAPPRVLRLRYEDIVANPAQALEAIFARFPQGTPLTRAGAGPAVSAPRSKRSVLDADDLAAIRAICAPAAARLGYTLDKPVATPSGR